jgi:hypothetical protein
MQSGLVVTQLEEAFEQHPMAEHVVEGRQVEAGHLHDDEDVQEVTQSVEQVRKEPHVQQDVFPCATRTHGMSAEQRYRSRETEGPSREEAAVARVRAAQTNSP